MDARVLRVVLVAFAVMAVAACEPGAATSIATPVPKPGTSAAPREVNLIAKDYVFLPDALELIPGETVLLHVINGGLEVHEAILGDARVQLAWEVAEAAVGGTPPGATPLVSVPPDVAGLRIVVHSGELVDVVWTVPAGVAASTDWFVGCHIAGHAEKGMVIPIHWSNGQAAP